jgi:5-methylcytosine-specific restriction endonuclease McrBC regulatory subunit McrC
MIIAVFLRELERFCRRHLRKDFHHTRQNLTGKVKGRILFRNHLEKNILLGRPDRFFCQYQVLSRDTNENRILRAALTQAKRCLSRQAQLLTKSSSSVWGWSSTSEAALSGVPLVRVADTDFNQVKLGGLKKAYRRPLYWAKKVLKLLGSDPNTDAEPSKDELPPFAIDMNELFERYCQALLLNEYGTNLWSGYQNINLGNLIKVRPDFIVKGKQIVLDAKYKYDWNDPGKALDYLRNDIYQIMAYTRHQSVAEKAGKYQEPDNGLFEKAIILYPYIQANVEGARLCEEEIICKDDFPLLFKSKIILPITEQRI